mmetsp:Transcript_2091/g.3839  ORF Transcript_2091/g.3839 Transcript_2091/m.3839 type:complete len:269 (-) Transcript_2091:738-1544(-)
MCALHITYGRTLLFFQLELLGNPKVCNLALAIRRQKKVLRLQISMDNTLLVQIHNPVDTIPTQLFCPLLGVLATLRRKVPMLIPFIIHRLPALNKFEYHVQHIPRLIIDHLNQRDQVGVLCLLHNRNFSKNVIKRGLYLHPATLPAKLPLLLKKRPAQTLDREPIPEIIGGSANNPKRPFPQHLPHLVLVHSHLLSIVAQLHLGHARHLDVKLHWSILHHLYPPTLPKHQQHHNSNIIFILYPISTTPKYSTLYQKHFSLLTQTLPKT